MNRGAAVYKNKVYLGTLDAHIVALDNAYGKVVWDKKMVITPTRNVHHHAAGPAQQDHLRDRWREYWRAWLDQAINADPASWCRRPTPSGRELATKTWPSQTWKYRWRFGLGIHRLPTTRTPTRPSGRRQPWTRTSTVVPRVGQQPVHQRARWLGLHDGQNQADFNYTPNDPYDYDGVNEVILVDIDRQEAVAARVRATVMRTESTRDDQRSKHGQRHQCVWVSPLQRVNWTKPIIPPNNCKPIYNWPEKDVVYDKVTTDIAPSLDGGRVAPDGVQPPHQDGLRAGVRLRDGPAGEEDGVEAR